MVASVHTSDFRALKWSVNRVFNGSVESLLAWKVEMSWAKLPLCFPPSPHRHRHHRGCLPSCWSGRQSCPSPCTRPGASPPASQGRSACEKKFTLWNYFRSGDYHWKFSRIPRISNPKKNPPAKHLLCPLPLLTTSSLQRSFYPIALNCIREEERKFTLLDNLKSNLSMIVLML